MIDKEALVNLMMYAAKSTAYNLEFIPDDRLTWKPGGEAKSALEIINHVLECLTLINNRLQPGTAVHTPVTTKQEATEKLLDSTGHYVRLVRDAQPERFAEILMPDRPVTIGIFAAGLVLDMMNHHGQITYIQTLFGDTEPHFNMDAFQHLA
jgi:uncharacterized damage-inducible protein DinB